jgi:hypothetical protein
MFHRKHRGMVDEKPEDRFRTLAHSFREVKHDRDAVGILDVFAERATVRQYVDGAAANGVNGSSIDMFNGKLDEDLRLFVYASWYRLS